MSKKKNAVAIGILLLAIVLVVIGFVRNSGYTGIAQGKIVDCDLIADDHSQTYQFVLKNDQLGAAGQNYYVFEINDATKLTDGEVRKLKAEKLNVGDSVTVTYRTTRQKSESAYTESALIPAETIERTGLAKAAQD